MEEVAEFTYLGSVQSTTGRCQRIDIASTVMQSMNRVWRQSRLQLQTKLHFYQTCILSIVLYGSEARTLLQEDLRKLEAFHMRCQRMILVIRWHDFIRNTEVADTTNLPCIKNIITRRRNSLFGHVVRLDDKKRQLIAHCHRSRQSKLAPALPVGAGEQVAHATRGFNKSPTAHLLAFAPSGCGSGFAVVGTPGLG